MDFHTQQFWIDIKKLPPEFLNLEVENQIASILGNPIKVIPEDSNPIDTNAISVSIEFHVSNPMLRGVMTTMHLKSLSGFLFIFNGSLGSYVLHVLS